MGTKWWHRVSSDDEEDVREGVKTLEAMLGSAKLRSPEVIVRFFGLDLGCTLTSSQ